jgi:hypothetical protein
MTAQPLRRCDRPGETMELFAAIALYLAEAVHGQSLTDGIADYDLPLRYDAQARVSVIAIDSAQIDITLEPVNPGYRTRQLCITVAEVQR